MLHLGGADPVDAWVASDGTMGGVHNDDFEELVGGILADPIRVEHSHLWEALANSLLGDGADGALVLELVDTLVLWLPVDLAYLGLDY